MDSKRRKKKKKKQKQQKHKNKQLVANLTIKNNHNKNKEEKEKGNESKEIKRNKNKDKKHYKHKKNSQRDRIEKSINRRKKHHQKIDNLALALFVAVLLFLSNIILLIDYQHDKKVEEKKKLEQEEIRKIKESLTDIIFLGDSITEMYDLEKYYHQPFINSGVSGWTTDDILNNLEDKVFQYKPKKIFLLIGTNDIGSEKSLNYTYNNIIEIIKKIKSKNKYVDIYLESIYPINDSDDEKVVPTMVGIRENKEIKKINKMLKEYCKENKITYINIYDLLVDDNGKLDINYTKDGLHMNEEGYEIITKELQKYI